MFNLMIDIHRGQVLDELLALINRRLKFMFFSHMVLS